MTDTKTKTQEEITLLNDEIVPGVKNELAPYNQADDREKQEIDKLIAEINMKDSNSIIFFASKAQETVTEVSDKMLEGVRNKEKILFTLSSSEVSIYGYADKLVEEKENAVSSYVIKMEK